MNAALRRRSRRVGRVLTLNSANYTIVGVLPRAFVFPVRDAELALPIVEAEARRVEGDVGFPRLVARLRPDVSRAQAEPLMTAVSGELQRLRPETNARKVAIRLTTLHEQIVGEYAVSPSGCFSARSCSSWCWRA